MRAVICPTFGDASTLTVAELPAPELTPDGVRIAVHAAGVNFADGLMVAGKYQEKLTPPFTPGMEAAGVVLETAPGVTTCKPGDRVMATLPFGAFADEAVARADDVMVIPDAMDFVTAAGFPVAWGTSHFGLAVRAGLKAGETLMVTGAAGGVGLTAVEVGCCLGATVIACAGGADKLAVARDHGAAHGIDYKTEDLRERVKALTGGRGVDVVYDAVGGTVFDAALRSLAPNGRLLVVGFASGAVPQVPANILLVKNVTVIGYYWGAYRKLDPQAIRESLREALDWYAAGRIRPHVSHTVDLAEAARALELLRNRASSGKVVLTTGRG